MELQIIDMNPSDAAPADQQPDAGAIAAAYAAAAAAQDPAAQQPAQPAPAPAPAPSFDPGVLAAEIARNIAAMNQQQAQPAQVNHTQEAARMLISQGMPPQAVQAMLTLNAAQQAENYARQQQEKQNQTVADYHESFWNQAEDIFNRYAARMPGIEVARESILGLYHRELASNPKFAGEVHRVNASKLPTPQAVSEAMAITIDGFSKKLGLTRPAAPLNLTSARAPVDTSTIGSDDPMARLDQRQKKQYLAFKTPGDAFDPVAFKNALLS